MTVWFHHCSGRKTETVLSSWRRHRLDPHPTATTTLLVLPRDLEKWLRSLSLTHTPLKERPVALTMRRASDWANGVVVVTDSSNLTKSKRQTAVAPERKTPHQHAHLPHSHTNWSQYYPVSTTTSHTTANVARVVVHTHTCTGYSIHFTTSSNAK
jgi:hypothetical protein